MTTNQIAYFNAKETERHNRAMEYETGRHNVADEAIRTQGNLITESHYVRMDSETLRHNLATEEQARQQLNLGYAQLDLGNRQLAESTRHNMASESLQLQSLSETRTHNRNVEKLGVINANEVIRHDEATESLQETLNGSTITANYAKSNESSARAELYRAQKSKAEAETAYINEQKKYYSTVVYTRAGRDVLEASVDVIRLAAPLAK